MVNDPEHKMSNRWPMNNMLENIRIEESRNGVISSVSPDNARQENIILTDRMLMGDNGYADQQSEYRRIADERDAERTGGKRRRKSLRRKSLRHKTYRRKSLKRKSLKRKSLKRKSLRRRR